MRQVGHLVSHDKRKFDFCPCMWGSNKLLSSMNKVEFQFNYFSNNFKVCCYLLCFLACRCNTYFLTATTLCESLPPPLLSSISFLQSFTYYRNLFVGTPWCNFINEFPDMICFRVSFVLMTYPIFQPNLFDLIILIIHIFNLFYLV